MPKQPVRAFLVTARGPSGEEVITGQIEIDCAECAETLTYLIPGHHLKTMRDVILDLLDHVPQLGGPRTLQKRETLSVTVGGALSKKPQEN